MENGLISVIVPVYNVERYLSKCIESIIHQTYGNLEIILVDDGSPDKCPEICDRFAQKDKRIKVIHKENGGVSSARNYGIQEASGELIGFVDSDDWLPTNSIQLLHDAMKNNNADIVYGATKTVGNFRNGIIKSANTDFVIEEDYTAWLNYIGNILSGPCGKLYKKDIILFNHIFFPDDVRSGEDTIFLLQYLHNCNTVASIKDIVYYYNRFISQSATRTYFQNYNNWMVQCIKGYEAICNEKKELLGKQMLSVMAKSLLNAMCSHCVNYMHGTRAEKIATIREAYQLTYPYLLDDDYTPEIERYSEKDARIAELLSRKDGAEQIYEMMNEQHHQGGAVKVANLLRNTMQRLKYFWYYQLGMN